MAQFDWHSDPVTRDTPVTATYRSTQNVRRFLLAECGKGFRFDRAFMAWIKDGRPKTMGEVADAWTAQQRPQGGQGCGPGLTLPGVSDER